MIEIIGSEGSHEYEVALKIRDALVEQWPGVDKSPASDEHIKIKPNAKVSGYQVSDIDVVVGGIFNRARHFVVRKPIKDRDGRSVAGVKARVQNFFCAIEVKGQGSEGVSIEGDEVNVRYKGKWKSATEQNVKQVHALKNYLEHQHIDLFVYRCLVLDGVDQLPKVGPATRPEAGAVASTFTAGELLASMVGVNGIGKWGSEYVMSSCRSDIARKALEAPIFQQVVPTRLDRVRMDRVASRRDEAERLAALLGKQRVHIRGHGGTGKTVLMMQAAHLAYQLHGRRTLVLTYNIALAGDIRRLLVLLGVPSSSEGGGVEVRTAMSFIYAWFSKLGLNTIENSLDQYDERCNECLRMIEGSAVSRDEIDKLIEEDADTLGFDAIIVDEAQDWPQPEARLLVALYGGERVSVADGREQLLRGKPTNWSKTLEKGQVAEEKALVRCLRMKRNLGVFANAVARLAGLNWQVEPNDEAAGGKVIIVLGSYADGAELVAKLLSEAKAAGNDEVDFLHCVPPSNVVEDPSGRRSRLAIALEGLGHLTWDGVNEAVRRDFPRSTNVFRVLQYESSRGLEGWTTVLEHLDDAWEYKERDWLAEREEADTNAPSDPARAARMAAWRWCMIALTRPMDTLVITLSKEASPASEIILQAARENPDFVDIRGR